MKSERYSAIDTLKAFGLVFVILGHHRHFLYYYIYSFHMPLFFFISGFLFKNRQHTTFKSLAVSKFKRLIIPYLLLSILLYLFWAVLSLVEPGVLKESSYAKGLVGIFYAQGQLKYMGWGVQMWFLPCLYLVHIGAFGILKLRPWLMVLMLSLLLVASHIWTITHEFNLPWSLNIVPSMIVFFLSGFYFQPQFKEVERLGIYKKVPGAGIFLFVNVFFFLINNGRIDVYQGIFHIIPYFYLSAFAGIFFYLIVSTLIPTNKISFYLAANSLLIYVFHMRAYTFVKPLLNKISVFHMDTFLYAAVASLLQILILIPVVHIVNRWMPFIVGNKKVSTV